MRRLGLLETIGLCTAFSLSSIAVGCVKKELYTQALADLQFERNRSHDLDGKLKNATAEIARLGKEMQARDAKLEEMNVAQADLVRKLDEVSILNVALQDRLKKAGQSVDQLTTEKGTLSTTLAETRKELEELRKQQAAAEARVKAFQDLVKRFQKLADAGKLKVVLRQGRMIIELPTDVLFDSGKSDVRKAGKDTILEVGKILATMPDRRFQVAGHTDNVKISTARYPSNWELSTARAVEVVKILVESKVKPENLSAAGYGEFDPISANDSDANKQKNRRIEITLVPNLEEFVKLPEKALPPQAPAPAPAPPPKK
ncbi:MAG: OmpA family protein [Polyangiaceae bacterium]|nr:OmpA family protein [Polyangiaceae bacterium]